MLSYWFPCRKQHRGRSSDEAILRALREMEDRMSQEFDNLKTVIADAVTEIEAAIAKIGSADAPAAIQAEADKLAASVASLKAAVGA